MLLAGQMEETSCGLLLFSCHPVILTLSFHLDEVGPVGCVHLCLLQAIRMARSLVVVVVLLAESLGSC
jgi:hypothetical protein